MPAAIRILLVFLPVLLVACAPEAPKPSTYSPLILISIDGYYRTAEDMDATLRGRPGQCWLQDRVLTIAALD